MCIEFITSQMMGPKAMAPRAVRVWILLVTVAIVAASPTPISIDDAVFSEHFANVTKIPLQDAIDFAGPAWHAYQFRDIVSRIATWIVPLIIMIGSFQFAPLRLTNTVFVACHVFANPITSIYNLLSKLAWQKEIHDLCQRSQLSESLKKSVAILLAANDDWHSYLQFISANSGDESLLESPKQLRKLIKLSLGFWWTIKTHSYKTTALPKCSLRQESFRIAV